MTTIAQIKGKWHVVKSETRLGVVMWTPISAGYNTSEEARAQQANIVFGHVS